MQNALEDAALIAEGVADQYEESADNMEEFFPGSAQIDEIREKADASRDWSDALNAAAGEIDTELLEEDHMAHVISEATTAAEELMN